MKTPLTHTHPDNIQSNYISQPSAANGRSQRRVPIQPPKGRRKEGVSGGVVQGFGVYSGVFFWSGVVCVWGKMGVVGSALGSPTLISHTALPWLGDNGSRAAGLPQLPLHERAEKQDLGLGRVPSLRRGSLLHSLKTSQEGRGEGGHLLSGHPSLTSSALWNEALVSLPFCFLTSSPPLVFSLGECVQAFRGGGGSWRG